MIQESERGIFDHRTGTDRTDLKWKPEERRELFDEAAGIVKYKKNKLETQKSLEIERENLVRVTDILTELERQVGPLKKQFRTCERISVVKRSVER